MAEVFYVGDSRTRFHQHRDICNTCAIACAIGKPSLCCEEGRKLFIKFADGWLFTQWHLKPKEAQG